MPRHFNKYVFPSSYDAYKGISQAQKRWNQRKGKLAAASSKRQAFTKAIRFGTGKRVVQDVPFATQNRNQFERVQLSAIAQGPDIEERERQIVRLNGVKIHLHASNQVSSDIYLRCLVLKVKTSTGQMTTSTMETDFFRGTGTQRNINWQGISKAQHKQDYEVNRTKYKVLWDKKLYLHRTSTSTIEDTIDQEFTIPLNELCHYDGPLSTDCNDGVYLVYYWNDVDHDSTLVGTSGGNIMISMTTHFKDIL